jgi:hypothetical protein
MSFMIIGLKYINRSNHPSYEDTGSYLKGALIIKENGGLSNFVDLWTNGNFKVAEYHPIYLLILSTFASKDLSFFTRAQFITLSMGLIVIVCLFFISRKFFDGMVPFLAAFLLSVNGSFLVRSSHVAVETTLILMVLISWYFMVRGVDNERYWLISGLAGGLAFMTKGTGLFLIPIFIISTLFIRGTKVIKNKRFYLFFIMFLIPCLPWFTRNIIVYGTPFYAGINSHLFWLDSWSEISLPKYELIYHPKELTYSWSSLPTMATYIKTHSPHEIIKLFLYGVKGEFKLLINMMNLVFNQIGGSIAGITLLIISLFGMLKDKSRSRIVYSVVTIFIFFVPMSWLYKVNPLDRFLTPLLPIFCLYTAYGIQEISNFVDGKLFRSVSRIRIAPIIPYALAVMLALMITHQVIKYRGLPAISTLELSEDQQELFSWMKDNVSENDTVLMGPTDYYWGFLWYVDFKGKLLPTAGNNPLLVNEGLDRFNEFLNDNKANIVILHKENYQYPKALTDYFEFDAINGLKEKKPVDGWELVYRHSQMPVKFLIYRINCTASAIALGTPSYFRR